MRAPAKVNLWLNVVGRRADGYHLLDSLVAFTDLADEIAAEAVEMTAFEDFVTEEVMKGRSILGLYPATEERTKAEFAAWRQANGR